ncbi:MAG: tRNA (adenosine(37)-N6)-dimethylallyltransferase MiaA [Christensenellales bacterium]
MKELVMAICGPTASGKSLLSMALKDYFPIEIIGMDAFQIYERLDIGTAKPSKEEQAQVKHHMIDIISPQSEYTVAEYKIDASSCIDYVINRSKLPVLVGGTGMYLRALSLPLSYGGAQGDIDIRKKYEDMASVKGSLYLHELLKKRDSKAAQKLHPNDKRRIIRALEVQDITGKPFSSQKMPSYDEGKYNIIPLALKWDREILYDRINKRVDIMFEEGLANEVKGLLDSGVSEYAQSMQAIGYKEIIPLLKGESSLEETKELIKTRSRQYAKRQLTWYRADKRVVWIDMQSGADSAIQKVVRLIEEEIN